MSHGLSVRPARPVDQPFLATLYRSARPDLQWIDAEQDLIETVIELQQRVLQEGAGQHYPNAMHFVIEKTQAAVGGLIVDFGHNEIRIVYLALLPQARGKGYGAAVLQGIQRAAGGLRCPVAVVVWQQNAHAKRVYLENGFRVEETQPGAERLVWYPPPIN